MEIAVDLDDQQPINQQAIRSILYLASIAFQLTVDLHLELKLAKIGVLVDYLAQNPLVKTRLKVKSIQKNPIKEYPFVAVGGTFDYLHIGHQMLLLYTVLAGKETIHIGVTGEALLVNKKYKELIQPLSLRMKNVRDFVRTINSSVELKIFELNDPFGPTITQERLDCLVASPQTSASIKKINEIRKDRGLRQLELIECPLMAPNKKLDAKISTTCIKKQLWLKNELTQQEFKEYKLYFTELLALINQLKQSKEEKAELAELWWNSIYLSYSEPWRFYHTNRHIYQLFKWWNSHSFQQQKQSLSLIQRITLELVLFFHDIVYRPGNSNNQKESADICQRFVKEYLGDHQQAQNIATEAKRLIVETESHSKPTNLLSQIVYDLDMGILNDPLQYKIYAENVRKEYWPLVGEHFANKRVQFLTKTLKEGLHFSFNAEHVHSNLSWEIEHLQMKQL